MKRATLLLDDVIYNRAKELSLKRGTTLKEVLNDLLRLAFQSLPQPKRISIVKIPLHKRNGPFSGVDIADRHSLHDLLNE